MPTGSEVMMARVSVVRVWLVAMAVTTYGLVPSCAARRSLVKHRNLVPALVLTALLTLSAATNASAQACASLMLETQAEVDAVSCSSVAGYLIITVLQAFVWVD